MDEYRSSTKVDWKNPGLAGLDETGWTKTVWTKMNWTKSRSTVFHPHVEAPVKKLGPELHLKPFTHLNNIVLNGK